MNTVLMHGPGISDPSKIVEREVPEPDIHAYLAVGYKKGGLPAEAKAAPGDEAPGDEAAETKAKTKKKA